MATATLDRPKSRALSSATSIPEERLGVGEDGHPVKSWDVNGEAVAFSLRPYEAHERKVYWNPQGPGAPMWWRSQERNEHGLQPIIQRECWVDGSFSPRNAWEEYMTIEWLKTIDGGSAGAGWVGFDHPKNKDLKPGEQPHRWVCATCGYAMGPWAVLEQHQRSKLHSGLRNT